jgi:transposase
VWDGVDKVRRQEHRQLVSEGDRTLTGTTYRWLQNPERMSSASAAALDRLKNMTLKTSRAWALKEHAMCLWTYASKGWARKAWTHWVNWAMRSRLEPMKRVARMVREHMTGIINAIVHRATNAAAESVNSRIQRVKRMACGFRNRERFRSAIYFHLGGLDMSPATQQDPEAPEYHGSSAAFFHVETLVPCGELRHEVVSAAAPSGATVSLILKLTCETCGAEAAFPGAF